MSYAAKTPEQAKELLGRDEGWTFVDVRTVEEFEQGHVPDAYNLPVAFRGPWGMALNPSFIEVFERNFQPQGKYILGCAAGGRSAKACEILAQQGFNELVNMEGGFYGARSPLGELVVPGSAFEPLCELLVGNIDFFGFQVWRFTRAESCRGISK